MAFGTVKVPAGPVNTLRLLRGRKLTSVRRWVLAAGVVVALGFGGAYTAVGHRLAPMGKQVFEEFADPGLVPFSASAAYAEPSSRLNSLGRTDNELYREYAEDLYKRLSELSQAKDSLARDLWMQKQAVKSQKQAASRQRELGLRKTQLRIHELRDALARDPGAFTLRRELANALWNVGDLTVAAAEFRTLVATEPEDVPSLEGLARTLCLLGEFAEALPFAHKAVRLKPDDFDARDTLAHAAYGAGLYDLAADTWRVLLRVRPGYTDDEDRSDCYLDQAKMAAALTRSRAIDLLVAVPSASTLDSALRALYRDAVRLAYDVELDRYAVRQKPDDATLRNSLAWNLCLLGRYQEALPHARVAARLFPKDASIQDTLGHAAYGAGHYSEAVAAWETTLQLKPGFFSDANHGDCRDDPSHLETARRKASEQGEGGKTPQS
jgi:tetratricopeptide (TPR) repeat protein